MLRTDRLRTVTAELGALLEAVPDSELLAAMPPAVGQAVRMARLVGLDVLGTIRATVRGSLAGLADMAERDPERASAVLERVRWLTDWLAGETDDPPPLDASSLAAGWPSSGGPGPARA